MKHSWFRLKKLTEKNFEAGASLLLKRAFKRASTTGFQIELADENVIDGRYIEKTEFTETVTDPFGSVTEIRRVRFDSLSFRVSIRPPELEVIDPPRNIRNFLSEICSAFENSIIVEKPEVDVLQWISTLKHRAKSSIVTKAVYKAIPVGSGVIGALSVAGAVDVRKPTLEFLRTGPAVPDRVTVVVTDRNAGPYSLELSSLCKAECTNCPADLVDDLRKGLEKLFDRPEPDK